MLRTTAVAALALAAFAASGFSAASAQGLLTAQEPSHNIACMASAPGPGQPTYEVRCDIRQTSTRLPAPPRNCPLSWGDAFVLDPTGPGRLFCHGDTVFDPSAGHRLRDPVAAVRLHLHLADHRPHLRQPRRARLLDRPRRAEGVLANRWRAARPLLACCHAADRKHARPYYHRPLGRPVDGGCGLTRSA